MLSSYLLPHTCRRYVLPTALPQLPARREGVPDHWLVQTLAQATSHLRSHLAQAQHRALAVRDSTEMLQLMSLESGTSAAAAAAAVADLPGRQSGAEAWRQARGETGELGCWGCSTAWEGCGAALYECRVWRPVKW
jgi:hypothetical protein